MQNGICEAFNGRTRDELLNDDLLWSRSRQIGAGAMDRAIQSEAPHSAFGHLTPAEFAGGFTATGDRLRNPDRLRRSPVAPPTLLRQSQLATPPPTRWTAAVTAGVEA